MQAVLVFISSPLMNNWKKHIPSFLKLYIKQGARKGRDIFTGTSKRFATSLSLQDNLYKIVEITQSVKTTPTTINKLHNLSLAIKQINNIIIQPGQVFSFWNLVGNPSEKKGYQKSRSIVRGEIETAVGGGLCQLSGLIYFLALKAGLTITERHAHSMDIYKEEERFTPLGSDATVVYGYKDLRIKNSFQFPIQLQISLTETNLSSSFSAKEKLQGYEIEFVYSRGNDFIEVVTIQKKGTTSKIIATNKYKLLHY